MYIYVNSILIMIVHWSCSWRESKSLWTIGMTISNPSSISVVTGPWHLLGVSLS